MRIKD